MFQLETDFCVVGSGISGMTAAYRLRKAGKSVIVLEASPHIGGRIWTETLTDRRTVFEIGAEWVTERSLQQHLWDLMQDLTGDGASFELKPQYIDGENVFVNSDGKLGYYYEVPPTLAHPKPPKPDDLPADLDPEYDGMPPIADEAKIEILAALAALTYMSMRVDRKARWHCVEFDPLLSGGVRSTIEADRMTVGNWLDQRFSDPAGRALLAALFGGTMGLEPEAISLLHAVFFLASFGCDPQKVMGSQEGQAQHLRMPQGVAKIIDAIVKAIGAENVRANSPVRDIVQTDDGMYVTVKTEDATVTARRVIVATTSAAANLIRFQPPLPPDRAQLQQRMGLGSVWKIWLVYDRPFWRPTLSGQVVCINPKSFVPNTRDSSLDNNGPGLLTCFVDADKAREFGALTRDQRRAIILDEMEHAFGEKFPGAARDLSQTLKFPAVGPQNPDPDAYFEWNWSLPEFIRGDYAGTPGPGVYTASGFGPAIANPCGRVHWAGSDTATETYGNMSGAVEAGDRAAAEVLEWEGKKQTGMSAAT